MIAALLIGFGALFGIFILFGVVVEVIRALGPVGMLIIFAFLAWLYVRNQNRNQQRRNHAPRP